MSAWLSAHGHKVLHAALVTLAVVFTVCIGGLLPGQGITVLGGLALAVLGFVIFFKPSLGLYLTIALVPLENVTMFAEGVTSVRVLGMVTFLGWLLHKLVRRETLQRLLGGPAFPPLVLLASLAVTSGLWASYREAWAAATLTLLQLISMYFLVIDLVGTWQILRRMAFLVLISSQAAVGLGLYQFYVLGLRYAKGGSGTSDSLGGIILVALPVALHLITRGNRLLKWLGTLFVCSGILAVIASGRRAVLLLLPFVFIVHWQTNRGSTRSRVVLAVLLGLVLAIALTLWGLLPWLWVAERLREGFFVGTFYEFGGYRGLTWAAAIAMFRERPLLGVGYGNYGYQLWSHYQSWGAGADYIWAGPRAAHSMYLEMLAELGSLGIMIWLAFLGMSFMNFTWVLHRARQREWKELGSLLAALRLSLLFYLLYGLVLSTDTTKVLWLLLALAGAARKIGESWQPMEVQPIRLARRGSRVERHGVHSTCA